MSPRPRSASDDEILDALLRAVEEGGVARLTLAAVAAACGLSAAAVAQRFGSKRALLLAYGERRAREADGRFAAARRAWDSPLGALVEALACATAGNPTPQALGNRLALAQSELDDEEFHAQALEHAQRMGEEIRALLEEAVLAGELAPCDAAGLARTVQTTTAGALATWVVLREGTADDWLRDELEAVLAPYLPG